ncbi:MAG: hypothetical protein V4792_05210 [Pseudomonadota bacterium]
MTLSAPLSPSEGLAQVVHALPESARANVLGADGRCTVARDVIIVGSLAADVDCLFSPHATAVAAAAEVTEQLLRAGWKQRQDAQWGAPGNTEVALEDLPMVRLQPPGGSEWFVELLAAPPQFVAGGPDKKLERVQTSEEGWIC